MLIKDHAICIRAVDYSETSQIVTLFTRASGKVAAIAKGSKRSKSAFEGPLEICSFGRIVFSDSSRNRLATLTEFEADYCAPAPGYIADNLFSLNCCLFAAELVDALTDDYDPHPALFDAFLNLLGSMKKPGQEKTQKLAPLIRFQLSLLTEIGLKPVLDACANCGSPFGPSWRRSFFCSSTNGLICLDCENSFPDRIKIARTTAACLNNPRLIDKAPAPAIHQIEKILVHHFTHMLNRPPRMAKYVLAT